jgi:hypothetical protein
MLPSIDPAETIVALLTRARNDPLSDTDVDPLQRCQLHRALPIHLLVPTHNRVLSRAIAC